MAAQFDAVTEATGTFTKLFERRNWLLGAPAIAGGLISGVIIVVLMFAAMGPAIFKAFTSSSQQPEITPFQIAFFVVGITIGVLLALVINAFVYGWMLVAAEPVWSGSDPAFDRGFNRAAAKLLPMIAYQLLVALLALVSIITIVGPIVVAVLALYGPAYILFGNRSATQAIGDSFKLASENLGETVILVLAFIILAVVAFVIQFVFNIVGIIIPGAGLVIGIATQWLFSAYIALAVVRFYDLLILSAGAPPIPIVPKTSV